MVMLSTFSYLAVEFHLSTYLYFPIYPPTAAAMVKLSTMHYVVCYSSRLAMPMLLAVGCVCVSSRWV